MRPDGIVMTAPVSLPRHRGPPWLESHTSGRTTSKGEDQAYACTDNKPRALRPLGPVGSLRPFRFQLFDRPLKIPLPVSVAQHLYGAPSPGLLSLEYLLSAHGNGCYIDATHARSIMLSAKDTR